MPSDHDLLTTLNSVEQLRQDRPRLTHTQLSMYKLYIAVHSPPAGGGTPPGRVTTRVEPNHREGTYRTTLPTVRG